MEFLDFPAGEDLWCVKWIDGYRQAHAASRSPSIGVLLQKLPLATARDVLKLDKQNVQAFLRRPFNAESIYKSARVHTGSLPGLRIGQVYRSQKRVATLRSEHYQINLPHGGESGVIVTCGQELERPAGWEAPFRVLNPGQFELPTPFRASRCLLLRDPSRKADIVIPCTLIEQTYYFPHSEFTKAFARGPWTKVQSDLIFLGAMESGLKTRVDPDTGEWQVILQSKVRDPYAPLLALLYFDPFASACAESLYSCALQDRGNDARAVWFASGRIPFSKQSSLRLELRGFWLAHSARKGSETFLASHIAAYDWPLNLPPIASERRNSGKDSPEAREVEGGRPFAQSESVRRAPEGNQVSAQNDGSPDYETDNYEGVGISFLSPPILRTLEKKSHQHFGKSTVFPPNPTEDPNVGSTGASSSRAGSDRKAQVESANLPEAANLVLLLRAIEKSQSKGVITGHAVLEPASTSMRADRKGINCWNFLDEATRSSGKSPKRGWCVLNPRGQSETGASAPMPRAALVVCVYLGDRQIIWIEIERRATEKALSSPALIDVPEADQMTAIEHALAEIAYQQGRSIRQAMKLVADEYPPARARCYHHAFVREEGDQASRVKEICPDSLKSFLLRCLAEPLEASVSEQAAG
jgi:hypothetical protein